MVEIIPHPHIVVTVGGKTHVIPLWIIRQVAAGELHADAELSQALARALLDNL